MAKVCALPWCRQTGSHLTFQTFPDNEIRQMQWLTLLDVADTWKDVPPEKLKDYRICNLHFDTRGTLLRAISTPLVTTAHVTQPNPVEVAATLTRQIQNQNQSHTFSTGQELLTSTSTSSIFARKSKMAAPHEISQRNIQSIYSQNEQFPNSTTSFTRAPKSTSKTNSISLSATGTSNQKRFQATLTRCSPSRSYSSTNYKTKKRGTTTSDSETNSDSGSVDGDNDDDNDNQLIDPLFTSSEIEVTTTTLSSPMSSVAIRNRYSNNNCDINQDKGKNLSPNLSVNDSLPKIISYQSLTLAAQGQKRLPSQKQSFTTQAPESTRWTRESFSLGKKIEIVRHLESGMKQADVCRIFSLPKSTVWSIWKNKEKIESAFLCSSPSRKKLRKSRFQEVDSALFKWYNNVSCQNVAVTTRLLQTMAETFAQDLGQTDFVCTSGWLERFKHRYCINLNLKKQRRKLEAEAETETEAPVVACDESGLLVGDQNNSLNDFDINNLLSFVPNNVTITSNYTNDNENDNGDSNSSNNDKAKNDIDIRNSISSSKSVLRFGPGPKSKTRPASNTGTGSGNSLLRFDENHASLPSALAKDWINYTWPKSRVIKDKFIPNSNSNANQKNEEAKIETYSPSDIFTAEETGILYRLSPQTAFKMYNSRSSAASTSNSKSDPQNQKSELSNFSIGKERITVMLCSNSNGSEKKRLCIFSQIESPSSIVSVVGDENNFSRLPVDYRYTSDPTSWINEETFGSWLKEWDLSLRESESNRRILLTLSSTPIHCAIPGDLTNIEIVLIPHPVTNFLQPFQQGVICEFKFRYRRLQLERLIYYLEQGKEANISLLDSILLLNTAWCEISQKTISEAFATAGIVADNSHGENKHLFSGQFTFKGFDTTSLVTKAVASGLDIPPDWEFKDFVDVDDCLFAVDCQPNQTENQIQNVQDQNQGATFQTGELSHINAMIPDPCNSNNNNNTNSNSASAENDGSQIAICTKYQSQGQNPNQSQQIPTLTTSEIQIYLDVIKMWAMSKGSPGSCPQKVHDAVSIIESFAYDH